MCDDLVHLSLVNVQVVFPLVILKVSMKDAVFSFFFSMTFLENRYVDYCFHQATLLKYFYFQLQNSRRVCSLSQYFQLLHDKDFYAFCIFNKIPINLIFLGIFLLMFSRIVILSIKLYQLCQSLVEIIC